MKSFSIMILALTLFCFVISCSDDEDKPKNTITDIDGNVYITITIGTQTWMAQNLKTTRYNNGDTISNVTNDTTWSGLSTGAYCYYDNNSSYNSNYGKLYNWYAVDDPRGLAPTGWHVPTDNDWQILVDYLGGAIVAGGKLKEAGTAHWNSPNTGATNETGFTALPGGYRGINGSFDCIGGLGCWWSSTEYVTTIAWCRYMYDNLANVISGTSRYKNDGVSIRCVRD